jgi:hypothetical protein
VPINRRVPAGLRPRRAGRPPGWPGTDSRRLGRGVRVWHPPTYPQGLPHGAPGADPRGARTRSVEGCPWAAAWSGCRRDTTRTPAHKIIMGDTTPS